MEFGLLGPLSVVDGDTERTPTAPKQRQMLALLLLHANHVVSMAQFTEELWEGDPPASAVAAVHTYIMQLRRTMHGGPAGDGIPAERLTTREHGYRLEVRPGELDLDVFEARLRVARDALANNEDGFAARQLRSALDLWRTHVLVDVPAGPLLRATIARIERNRLDAIGQRICADLNLGRHHELIGELSALVYHHRTSEDLAAQLMLALYRSGRQADALATFHRLRRVLRDDVGAIPSPRMHQLYTDILSAHPRLETSSSTRTPLSLDLIAAPSS
ncbi:MAG: AfsR/SARP family transcriptional regulator [Pseudonocardiaceae bacterium]